MPDLQFDPATTAVVVIDLQHAIAGRQTAPYSAASVIGKAADLTGAFRSAGALIVFVRVDLADIVQIAADRPMRDPNAPPPPPNASELVPELGITPDDLIITKRSWDAFWGTDLEKKLRQRGIRTILLCGIATNFGVESTARSAAANGFDVVIIEDATTSMTAEVHQFAIDNIFPRIARVRKASELSPH